MLKAWRCVAALVIGFGGGAWARGETLRGNAVVEGGSPAVGARVWAVKLWIQKLERIETKADDKGGFSLGLPPGQWLIDASLGDQGVATMSFITVAEGQALKPLELKLGLEGRLRVKMVEAETGKPIAGGRLVIDNGLAPTTDADGRFEIGGITRSRYHEAFVNAPGRERKRVLFEMSEKPVTDLEIPVARGGKAVGRVLDLEGKPIAGAFVGRSTSGSTTSLSGLWVRADDQGKYEFDGLVLDRTTWLNAVADGYEEAKRDGVRADLASGPLAIDFRLARNPAARQPQPDAKGSAVPIAAPAKVANRRDITGVILDPDKKPVANATVRWGLRRNDDSLETKTGTDGKYRIAFAPDQPGVMSVVPEQTDLAPDSPTVAGGDQEINVTLEKAHTVKGLVCDDRGTPFVGVMVLPVVGGPGMQGLALWERSVKTDAQGRFTILGLPASGTLFTFLGSGVSDLRDHPLDLDKDNKVLMTSSGAIRGRVVDVDGKPVRNFRVLLNGSRERKPDDKFGGFFAGFCGIGLTFSSDDGSFLIRNLSAGSVQRVTVLAPGYGEGTLDRVVAEPLSHLNPEKPLKFWLARPYRLKVHAVEEGSIKPIANARVDLIYDDPSIDTNFSWGYHDTAWGDSVHARTDAQGVADFSPLSFSEATILVRAPGYARQHLGWRDASDEVNVILGPEAVVSGKILDATTGKPIEDVNIHLSSPATGQINSMLSPDAAGRFRIGELSAGSNTFSITSKAGQVIHNEVLVLKPGETVSRTIRVSLGVGLHP